ESLDELFPFLNNDFPEGHMFSKIEPTPIPKASPQPWLLGTSEKSAVLAAEIGMPYTFGHFMSSQDGLAIVRDDEEGIAKHDANKVPQAIAAIPVTCAKATEEPEELALSKQLWKVPQDKGEGQNGVPSSEEARSYPFNEK